MTEHGYIDELTGSDILGAYVDFCDDLNEEQLDFLRSRGIPAAALGFDNKRRHFKIRTSRVVFLDLARFEFAYCFRGDRERLTATIIVCRDELGEVADLCAWSPKLGAPALWLGKIGLLGEENALAPRVGSPALDVHSTPEEWLAENRRGVVVVDPQRARPILNAASPLVVRTVPFGQTLRALLTRPSARILVEQPPQGAVAA
jgi:hypothetical protein